MLRPTIDELTTAEVRVLARLRLEMAAHLAAAATQADPSLGETLERPFRLRISCPGCPPAYVACRRGDSPPRLALTASSGGERPAGHVSLTLRFLSASACAKALSGGRAVPIPVPGGPGAGTALNWFRAAAPRAAALIADTSFPVASRARLMAVAAVRGLAAVGTADAWLADRLAHVPDGSVAVVADGSFSLGLEKRGGRITASDTAPERPDARLEFARPEAALAVLSGKRQAVVALGAGEVSIRGLLPLVQGLFGVLDRLAHFLAVGAAKGAGH
jgi:hypothetical protein